MIGDRCSAACGLASFGIREEKQALSRKRRDGGDRAGVGMRGFRQLSVGYSPLSRIVLGRIEEMHLPHGPPLNFIC